MKIHFLSSLVISRRILGDTQCPEIPDLNLSVAISLLFYYFYFFNEKINLLPPSYLCIPSVLSSRADWVAVVPFPSCACGV